MSSSETLDPDLAYKDTSKLPKRSKISADGCVVQLTGTARFVGITSTQRATATNSDARVEALQQHLWAGTPERFCLTSAGATQRTGDSRRAHHAGSGAATTPTQTARKRRKPKK